MRIMLDYGRTGLEVKPRRVLRGAWKHDSLAPQ